MAAAPLLDSSSGWACTAIRRSGSLLGRVLGSLTAVGLLLWGGGRWCATIITAVGVPTSEGRAAVSELAGRYGTPPSRGRRRATRAVGALAALGALAWVV